jgi:hypothetical protein
MSKGSPLLRRAPSRLWHTGAMAAMVLVSVALLAGLVSAGPLFGSATAYGGLVQKLTTIPETASPTRRPMVEIAVDDPMPASEPKMQALIDAIPYLDDHRTTLVAHSWLSLREKGVTPYIMVGGVRLPALLYTRTGVLDGLQVASGTPGSPGLWLPESTAEQLGVKSGSKVLVGKTYRWSAPGCGQPFFKLFGDVKGTDTEATISVAGTYRTAPNGRTPLGPYFSKISSSLPGDPGHCPLPGVLLIGDLPTITSALSAVKEMPLWTSTAELSRAGRTPDRLRRTAVIAADLRSQVGQRSTPVGDLLNSGAARASVQSGLPEIERQVEAVATAARQQGRGMSYAGGVLGLAAVVLGLRALVQRRRRETELLLGLGTPMWVIVLAGTLELLVPTVLGAAAGFGVACWAFSAVGPHPGLDARAVVSAGLGAAAVVGVVLVSHALVLLGQVRQISRTLSGFSPSRFGSQWLSTLTGATVLAVFGTLTRDRGESFTDPLSALLPILVLACGCAVLVRAATGVRQFVRTSKIFSSNGFQLNKAKSLAPRRGGGGRLGVRGLRGTGVVVSDLVIVLSIGVGLLAYGLIASVAVNQSVADKAAVLAGAPSTAHLRHSWLLGGGDGPSPHLPPGTTVVWRAPATIMDADQDYDVLVVNPPALRSAASWGSGPELAAARAALDVFGNPTPASVARDAQQRTPVPALLIGPPDSQVGTIARVAADQAAQQVEIRRRLTAFPGVVRPTLVLDARSFFPRLARELDPSFHAEVLDNYDIESNFITSAWTQQSMPTLRKLMLDNSVPVQEVSTLAQAEATPVLMSSRWAASYQGLLGLVAAVLAGLALLVAVDRRVARAAPVDLMLRRFGITSSRLLRVRAVELAGTCAAALVVLAGPLAVMVLLLPRLIEPDTEVPPTMSVRVTAVPLMIGAGAAVVITVLAVVVAARRSAALKPGEVLRDDA